MSDFVREHFAALLLAIAFVFSLTFFLVWPPERIARTLYFPRTTGSELSAETRLLPRNVPIERSVQLVVEDSILGPKVLFHRRPFPRVTRVRSVMIAEGIAYVNLSTEAILGDDRLYDPATGIEAIRRSVLHNFRRLADAVITIEGQVPFSPAYHGVGNAGGSSPGSAF